MSVSWPTVPTVTNTQSTLLTIDQLRLIIKNYIGLNDYQINIWNQKFNIPTDDGLYITLHQTATKVYANRQEWSTDSNGNPQEIDRINVQEMFDIEVFSRSYAAMQSKELVVLALGSQLSIQTQERNGFRIARIANMQNITMPEPTALLYRWNITVFVLAAYTYQQLMQYFNTYNVFVGVNGDPNGLAASFTQQTALPIT